jgi:hypothetical protein
MYDEAHLKSRLPRTRDIDPFPKRIGEIEKKAKLLE